MTDEIIEINTQNFTPTQRREWIASRLMGSPTKITGKVLAEELKVSAGLISQDLNSDEYLAICDEYIIKYLKGNLVPTALKNISKSIMSGDLKTSMWLVERVHAAFSNKFELKTTKDVFQTFQEKLAERIGDQDGNGKACVTGLATMVIVNPELKEN